MMIMKSTTTNNTVSLSASNPSQPCMDVSSRSPQQQQQQQQPQQRKGCNSYSFWRGFSNRVERRRRWNQFLNHSVSWRVTIICSTIVLLFGSAVRDILIPEQGDVFFNILFLLTIALFSFDILVRIDCEPSYFNLICSGRNLRPLRPRKHDYDTYDDTSNGNEEGTIGEVDYRPRHGWNSAPLFSVGSFLFWCDVISTYVLFSEVSWIRPDRFRNVVDEIYVDELGFPSEQFLLSMPSNDYLEISSMDLFVVIGKTLRMARVIRSPKLIKYSSKINWYFVLNLFDPLLWWNFFKRCCCSWTRTNNNADSHNNHTMHNRSLIGRSSKYASSDTGFKTISSQINVQNTTATGGVAGTSKSGHDSGSNHGSRSSLRLSSPLSSAFLLMVASIFRRDMSTSDRRRMAAAIIIQRAWRRQRRRNAIYGALLDMRHYEKSAFFEEADGTHLQPPGSSDKFSARGEGSVLGSGGSSSAPGRLFRSLNGLGQSFRPGMSIRGNASFPFHKSSPAAVLKKKTSQTVGNALKIDKPNNANKTNTYPNDSSNSKRNHNIKRNSSKTNNRNLGPLLTGESALASSNFVETQLQRRNESQVGTAMREIAGQRVAIGIIMALIMTVVFTYTEENYTRKAAMITLHTQTQFEDFAITSIDAARRTSIPDLFSYQLRNGTTIEYNLTEYHKDQTELRPRELLIVKVIGVDGESTIGKFSYRSERREQSLVTLLSTFFIILTWFFGATGFAGPVMVLVVIPMERMVRLLAMLTVDPLGYQSTSRYKSFVVEESEITRNTRWTKEVLKGMETSFLMSTIMRIGSLMKVGFGSAGVEIIRRNLAKEQSKSILTLSSQGTTVSCIFLFCDIRNFTDATECLQEEVFVFTNRIAAVVHSNCAAYGGSANKNIGDAFLMSWLLDEDDQNFCAKNDQADKALLAVVRMCMALRYDEYYLGEMSDVAREALVTKLSAREGPIVQMGFGLHAGKAVQGAIGSQKKIDATYVGESVERAEFLESSTKKYGLPMLMSDNFHRLLDQRNKRRCRKVDVIMLREDSADNDDDDDGEMMDLLTFDVDIDGWWNGSKVDVGQSFRSEQDGGNENNASGGSSMLKRVSMLNTVQMKTGSRKLVNRSNGGDDEAEALTSGQGVDRPNTLNPNETRMNENRRPTNLVLPNGPALYNANVWFGNDMRKIRERYSDGIFFKKFNSGLVSFYKGEWDQARECFATILGRFEDGPSRYFLNQIEANNGKPPRDFRNHGIA